MKVKNRTLPSILKIIVYLYLADSVAVTLALGVVVVLLKN